MLRLRGLAAGGALALAAGTAAVTGSAAGAAVGPAIFHQPNHAVHSLRNLGWASSNWSGYAETAGAPYTQATANWTVPSVSSSSSATYSSDWVGIDGFKNSDLIQTGTESDYYSGRAHYDAWWEILPAPETVISTITVSPGNKMQANIVKDSTTDWTITITDVTTGKSFSTTQVYTGPGASAEWIVERPEVGGRLATLAHYKSPVTFDKGLSNNANPALTASDGGEMLNNSGTKVISIPSKPDSDTDGFNCSYGSTAPSPPSS